MGYPNDKTISSEDRSSIFDLVKITRLLIVNSVMYDNDFVQRLCSKQRKLLLFLGARIPITFPGTLVT